MNQDATDRLRRLLSVIPLFADATSISRSELVERTGVETSVLLDDLRVVTERLDAPGGFVEDLRVEIEADRISVHSSHFQRPTRINVSELCALELGLAMLRAITPPDESAPVGRARAKLRQAITEMPADGEESWEAHLPALPDEGVASEVARAARSRVKVRIAYQSGRADHAEERLIHPYYVLFSHGAWYVIAHCERSERLRFFRADRIQSAQASFESFTRPDTLPIDVIRSGKPFQGSPDEKLVVRYSRAVARWIAEREGTTPDADGCLTVQHHLGDDHWAVRHVLQYGPEAEVLSPRRIREKVVEVLTDMLV